MSKIKKIQMPMWLIIVLVLGIVGFVYFFTKPNNSIRNMDKYVSEYINNSIKIEINDIDNVYDIEFTYIYTGLNLNKLNRSKLSSIPNNYFSIYDSNRNKYFRVLLIDSPESMKILRNNIYDKLVKTWVNQSQLDDPSYGTRENPIPVLYVEIPKYKKSPNYWMIEKTPEEYKKAVYYYLAYIMPKEEFKQRFLSGNKN